MKENTFCQLRGCPRLSVQRRGPQAGDVEQKIQFNPNVGFRVQGLFRVQGCSGFYGF